MESGEWTEGHVVDAKPKGNKEKKINEIKNEEIEIICTCGDTWRMVIKSLVKMCLHVSNLPACLARYWRVVSRWSYMFLTSRVRVPSALN